MSAKQSASLDGLIQVKGASRPETLLQRSAAPMGKADPVPTAAAPAEPRAKSLTLRLSETQYQRLRRFAFDRGQSHQDVIERALMEYLDRATST